MPQCLPQIMPPPLFDLLVPHHHDTHTQEEANSEGRAVLDTAQDERATNRVAQREEGTPHGHKTIGHGLYGGGMGGRAVSAARSHRAQGRSSIFAPLTFAAAQQEMTRQKRSTWISIHVYLQRGVGVSGFTRHARAWRRSWSGEARTTGPSCGPPNTCPRSCGRPAS